MNGAMDRGYTRAMSLGLSQRGVRDHNERLVLSLIQRAVELPASDLARQTGLSAPTVSGTLRRLETEGLLLRGEPVRGKVGKPSVPISLDPDGVMSLGLKIGRRSAEMLLLDFAGRIRGQETLNYPFPLPDPIFSFMDEALHRVVGGLPPALQQRLCGIGVAAPFEMWNWHDLTGEQADEFRSWKDVDFAARIARFTDLPVMVINDATAACRAEHVYGRGRDYQDYAYFYVGAFVGGGIVLNNSVYEGRQGNAGALGSLRSVGPNGESRQLIDLASIHLLEKRLRNAELSPDLLWRLPQDWSGLMRHVEPWLGQTAQELAKACISTCAVIDFEAVLIDGAFPPAIRHMLVDRIRRYVTTQDMRGLIPPKIIEAQVGLAARAIGAASAPIWAQFFLNTNGNWAA